MCKTESVVQSSREEMRPSRLSSRLARKQKARPQAPLFSLSLNARRAILVWGAAKPLFLSLSVSSGMLCASLSLVATELHLSPDQPRQAALLAPQHLPSASPIFAPLQRTRTRVLPRVSPWAPSRARRQAAARRGHCRAGARPMRASPALPCRARARASSVGCCDAARAARRRAREKAKAPCWAESGRHTRARGAGGQWSALARQGDCQAGSGQRLEETDARAER